MIKLLTKLIHHASQPAMAIIGYLTAVTSSLVAAILLEKLWVGFLAILFTSGIVGCISYLKENWYKNLGGKLSQVMRQKILPVRKMPSVEVREISDKYTFTIEDIAKIERNNGTERVVVITSNLKLELPENKSHTNCPLLNHQDGKSRECHHPLVAAIGDNLLDQSRYDYIIPSEKEIKSRIKRLKQQIELHCHNKQPNRPDLVKLAMKRFKIKTIRYSALPFDAVVYGHNGLLNEMYLYLNKDHKANVFKVISSEGIVEDSINFLLEY